jgi:hypothetical protein
MNNHRNSGGRLLTTTNHTDDTRIRRGAEIVRKQIIQQQQHEILVHPNHTSNNNNNNTIRSSYQMKSNTTNQQRQPPQYQQQQHQRRDHQYDADGDFDEITTEDNLSVTSWSEYGILQDNHHHSNKDTGRRRFDSTSSIEIDPPSVADWSVEEQIDTDDVTENDGHYHFETTNNSHQRNQDVNDSIEEYTDDMEKDDVTTTTSSTPRPLVEEQKHHHPVVTLQHIEKRNSSTKNTNDTIQRDLHQYRPTSVVAGFVSSDDDHDDDDDDDDNNSDDIVEVDEPMFDPFARQDQQKQLNQNDIGNPNQSPRIDSKLLSTSIGVGTFSLTNHQKNPTETISVSSKQRILPNAVIPTACSSSGSSSEGDNKNITGYRHRTKPISPKNQHDIIFPLPFHLESITTAPDPRQQNKANTSDDTEQHKNSNMHHPSFFMDYDVDAYCGYGTNHEDNEDLYESPEGKPVRDIVPGNSPSNISNLSTPQIKRQQQKSSAYMIRYDKLLRDPAYIHAQQAGFIWQSIVGQHIRFPDSWWDGDRGPPISSDTNIPWMYFGRHTIKQHPILNQLVKCRASAGRLLLHIIVQDLMTRTPIQDIVIGCFHPNSKGIRPDGTPALKRYEDCRDIWMAVHKRSHTSVAATDSLLYSPSHWENRATTSTIGKSVSNYNYTICRSPLGSGRRIANHNVRAVFGDKAPLETIFLSEDELYERLAARIIQHQNIVLPDNTRNNTSKKINHQNSASTNNTQSISNVDISPPLVILQELVFA